MNPITVIKRDGSKAEFDLQKIVSAIQKAMAETEAGVEPVVALSVACQVSRALSDTATVEEIQDLVEDRLMASQRRDAARAYIRYRYLHTISRTQYDDLMDAVAEKLSGANVQNQNANVDEHSFGGRLGEATNVVVKKFALDHCVSSQTRRNHENNEVYIHDLDRYVLGMHNCYHSNTAFVTDQGVKRFRDLSNGQKVMVVDCHGQWRQATVKSYGRQKMYDLVFICGTTTKTVTCTRDHRWLLANGEFTDFIQVGDKLHLLPELCNTYPHNEPLWCFGFVLGDGTDFSMRSKDKTRVTNGSMQVRLCGAKTQYLETFTNAGWTVRQVHDNGDVTLISRGNGSFKQSFLDNKFWKLMSYNDLCNVFSGFLAADGSLCSNGSASVSTSDPRIKEFIQDVSSVAGYYVWSEHEKHNSTNYKADRTLYEFYLTRKQRSAWTLTSIKANRSSGDGGQVAWCVEEPITHTFTLAGGMVTGNCLSIPFDKLLANGFNTRQTDVRPARSVSTAFQLMAVIFQLQSLQQFGGVSATHLDWTMVPYVRLSFYKHYRDGMNYLHNESFYMDSPEQITIDHPSYRAIPDAYRYALELTERETRQAVEGMYHNLNTLQSRSGNQLPFTSINYGTCTMPEGRMVTRALLQVSIEGNGKLHKTSVFPCGIFQCMRGVNRAPGDPNYDLFQLALQSTAKRLYPNYANVDWSGNAGYDRSDPKTYFSTMGCRTANGWDINGMGQTKDGRGNIAPTTIILPTLAMEALQFCQNIPGDHSSQDVVTMFMQILDEKLHQAKDSLIDRFEYICQQNPKSASFMYENGVMEGYDGKNIRSALCHGTLAIGMLGLAETLQLLIGKDHTTPEGMALAKRICQLYKDRCAEFKEQYKLNFGVYYTPAENLCYTAMQKFKQKYGVIPNVSDREYFTNSIHVPVWHQMTPFEKIDIESQLTSYSSAGCITYVELDSSCKHNTQAIEELVNYAMDHDIPYFAINIPNDTCLQCGYTDEINDACPMCGSKNIQRLRRVTGLS